MCKERKVQASFGWKSRKVGGWKIVEGWKTGMMKNIQFSLLCVWLKGGKMGGWKTLLFGWREKGKDGKYNLYKLTIIPLLHNM